MHDQRRTNNIRGGRRKVTKAELGATEVDHEGRIVRENLSAYKHFKSKALQPAIEEINAKTDLIVTYKEEKAKGSKAVRALTFAIRENLENVDALRPVTLPARAQMELTLSSESPIVDPKTRKILSELAEEFGLSRAQETALEGYVIREGLDYLLEKAQIVRSEPRANAGRAFIAALKADWQRPVKIEQKKASAKVVTEPPGWREWIGKKYPNARIPDSFRVLQTLYSDVAELEKLAAAN